MIGSKLAHFEVTALLGSGGMGEVYQATDTKLGRSVAIKVLPEAFTHDVDRLARFEREARVLASLNHSNIAAIFGLEESGDRKFLVMELVAGETLAERIKRGAIPLDESLEITKQICEALESAHEKGIVHRDLKPANVKITPDGKVKVLDFGLAKAFENERANATLSNSPTISMAATNAGIIIGTAAYMAPEQARGRNADHRSDVFAIGCILYEMLTGRQPFQGEDVSDILAAVLRTEPDFSALPSNVTPRVRELVRRCLEKNPKKRWHAVGDLRIEIENAMANPATEVPSSLISKPRRTSVWQAIAAALAMALAATFFVWAPWRTTPPAAPLRISGELGADVTLATSNGGNAVLALSPDGSTLAFIGLKNGERQIYLRRLGQLQASPLAGTAGAQSPFFSPDGQWLAFIANGKLKKISLSGGPAVTLADAPVVRPGSWGEDGNIVFSSRDVSLSRVPSGGGKVEPQTKLLAGEAVHRPGQIMPGGKALLYISSSRTGSPYDDANIVIQPLPVGTPKVVIQGGYNPRYVPSGHLLYVHEGTLFAAPFDLNRLELTGPSVPVVEGISVQPFQSVAQFAVSETGVLAYVAGTSNSNSVVWMTHDGKHSPLLAMPSNWGSAKFSPDGRKLALNILQGGNVDVWLYEWARDTLTRLTTDPDVDQNPVWTPDGQRIAFESARAKGPLNLYWQRADGAGEVQRLTESTNDQHLWSVHPSGKYLAFSEVTEQNSQDIMILPLEGDEKSGWNPGKPSVFLSTPANETVPMFSPDGRWIAYQSVESGRFEIYVRPFPGRGGKWQISTAGGVFAAWSQKRHELFYRAADNRIMVASYTVEGDSFKADKPRVWSDQPIMPSRTGRSFDLHPDGDRVAVGAPSNQSEEKLDKVTFVFNFFDELRRIAPPSKK
jgi:serine/threonine protein kinase